MTYPSVLPSNAKSLNFVSEVGFNPVNDIVLSVEFNLSGTPLTEAGISFFLTDNSTLIGGMSGTDLCYSGSPAGITTARLGVGLDSTGSFGLSAAIAGTQVRDGFNELSAIPNSVAIRSGASTAYSIAPYNYYVALSALNPDLKLVQPNSRTQILRFRLGNLGTMVYLDHKFRPTDEYKPVLQFRVASGLFRVNSYYRVGFGLTTPVSSNNALATANVRIKTVHLEGRTTQANLVGVTHKVWSQQFNFWEGIEDSWPVL